MVLLSLEKVRVLELRLENSDKERRMYAYYEKLNEKHAA